MRSGGEARETRGSEWFFMKRDEKKIRKNAGEFPVIADPATC
jgi:hypothetical protein